MLLGSGGEAGGSGSSPEDGPNDLPRAVGHRHNLVARAAAAAQQLVQPRLGLRPLGALAPRGERRQPLAGGGGGERRVGGQLPRLLLLLLPSLRCGVAILVPDGQGARSASRGHGCCAGALSASKAVLGGPLGAAWAGRGLEGLRLELGHAAI